MKPKEMVFYKAHPIMIFFNLRRVLFLVAIPVFRGLIAVVQGGLDAWGQGIWLDLVIFSSMILIAFFRWFVCRYWFDQQGIWIKSGVFISRTITLEWDKVTTFAVVNPLFLRLFHASFLRIDTLGGGHRNADVRLYLHCDAADALANVYTKTSRQTKAVTKDESTFVPSFGSILALAFLSTNAFAGVIYIATFISQSGRLLGNRFSHMLLGTFEEVARSLAFHIIPPAAAAIAVAMVLAWLIGAIFAILRYKNFNIRRNGNALDLCGGLFTKRNYALTISDINYLDIRQNILTFILRYYSMYLAAVGCGKDKNDITCVIPFERKKTFEEISDSLFPEFQEGPLQVRPRWTGIMRYVATPVVLCLVVPFITVKGIRRFASWKTFILFVGLMVLVPCVLFLVVRVIEFVTSGIGIKDEFITMRFSHAFTIHTLMVPQEKIVKIELVQTLFQQVTGSNCDILVYTISEGKQMHKCRNLNKEEVEKLLKIPEASPPLKRKQRKYS